MGVGRVTTKRGLQSKHARTIIFINTSIVGAAIATHEARKGAVGAGSDRIAISIVVKVKLLIAAASGLPSSSVHAGPRGAGPPGTGALDTEGMGTAGASPSARTRTQRAGLSNRSANNRKPPRPGLTISRTARGLLCARCHGAAARLREARRRARKMGGVPRSVDMLRSL